MNTHWCYTYCFGAGQDLRRALASCQTHSFRLLKLTYSDTIRLYLMHYVNSRVVTTVARNFLSVLMR